MTVLSKLTKYTEGKIYQITRPGCLDVYIGSTILELKERLRLHGRDLKQYQNGTKKSSCTSFQLISTPGYEITLIEDWPCANVSELEAREQEWIDQTPNCLNTNKAFTGLNREEYNAQRYQNNRDKIRGQQAHYHAGNREKILERKSERIECPCGSHVRQGEIARHKRTQKHIQWQGQQPAEPVVI